MKKLLTNEEKEEANEKIAQQRLDAEKPFGFYDYERTGYMTRQPRLDLSKYNYNYEQFKQYTSLYEEARAKDKEGLRQFYKMVKYSLAYKDKGDQSALSFAKRFRLDLIEIPDEFKDEPLDDIKIKKDKRTRRTFIRNRTNRDISNYDAWRVHDREFMKTGGKMQCTRKIMVPPALLIKAFGEPDFSRTGFDGTGEYEFEDNNLDLFNIADYRQTQMYHGLNREPEFYDRDLNKPPQKREIPRPTIEEFWTITTPKEFKLYAGEQADFRKFKTWLRKFLKEVASRPTNLEEEALAKYAAEIDICVGNYEEKGNVNHTDIAVFKYDFTYFMTPEEIKKLSEERLPEPLTMPKSFDLTKAERVYITKEELKRRELEEAEKNKQI